jgi:hypothetical protein
MRRAPQLGHIHEFTLRYNAADIEVLSGLDPVKRRPACTPTPRGPTTWRRK